MQLNVTELHDAVFVVGALEETVVLRGMRYHPIDIENTVMRCHQKIAEWYFDFIWIIKVNCVDKIEPRCHFQCRFHVDKSTGGGGRARRNGVGSTGPGTTGDVLRAGRAPTYRRRRRRRWPGSGAH